MFFSLFLNDKVGFMKPKPWPFPLKAVSNKLNKCNAYKSYILIIDAFFLNISQDYHFVAKRAADKHTDGLNHD